jgi:hypothetical protein
MTMTSTRIIVLLTAATLVTVCGCGGSNGLSRSQLVAKADPICRQANQALATSKISPQNVAQVGPSVAAAQRQASIKLSKLAPPSALASDWETIVASWRTAAESLLRFDEAAKAKDTQGVTAAEKGFLNAQAARMKAASRDGFHDCATF